MSDKFKALSAKDVARWFINHVDRASGEAITQLKVQKLVYYADAWYLANFDKPLIKEDFQAWAHGPAIHSLYREFKDFGWNAIPEQPCVRSKIPSDINDYLEAVYEEYGQFSAKRLEEMTHEELPWQQARRALPAEAASQTIIPKIVTRNYYAEKIGKQAISELPN